MDIHYINQIKVAKEQLNYVEDYIYHQEYDDAVRVIEDTIKELRYTKAALKDK